MNIFLDDEEECLSILEDNISITGLLVLLPILEQNIIEVLNDGQSREIKV